MAVSGRLLVFVVGVCLFASLCEVGGRRGGSSRFSRYRSTRYRGSSGGAGGSTGLIVGAIFGVIGGVVVIVVVVLVCRAFCCKSTSSASSSEWASTNNSQGVVISNTTPAQSPQTFYNKSAYDETNADNGFQPPPSYESAVNADQSGDTYPTKTDYSYSSDAPGVAYQPSYSGDVSYPAHPAPAYSAEFTSGAAPYSNTSDGSTTASAPQYSGTGTATPTAIGFETTPI